MLLVDAAETDVAEQLKVIGIENDLDFVKKSWISITQKPRP